MEGRTRPDVADDVRVIVVDETTAVGDVDPIADALASLDRWADLVRAALVAEGVVGPAETNVVFVDVDEMAALNVEHMGATGPTDVLSFPIDDDDDAGQDGSFGDATRLVGDIVVCPAVAAANAPAHAGDLLGEIALLLVHGSLHLVGHDHAEADERARMWARERELLAELWGALPRDPWIESDGPAEAGHA